MPTIRSTTILTVRRDNQLALGGDGQVSLDHTVAKADAVKVRRLDEGGADGAGVLVGFAGGAADAFSLLEKFEKRLADSPGNIKRAAIELARLWRTDRALRRLESLLVIADRSCSLLVSGSGDVIEPTDGIVAAGSGGAYATAAARALIRHTAMDAEAVCHESLALAAELCIYTNEHRTVMTL